MCTYMCLNVYIHTSNPQGPYSECGCSPHHERGPQGVFIQIPVHPETMEGWGPEWGPHSPCNVDLNGIPMALLKRGPQWAPPGPL